MRWIDTLERRLLARVSVAVDAEGVALITGTTGRDEIHFFREGRAVEMAWRAIGGGGGAFEQTRIAVEVTSLKRIVVLAGAGDDLVIGGRLRVPFRMYGGDGRDTLSGGARRDLLVGERDNDLIYDGRGDGNDYLLGGRGSDRLIASGGNDTLVGGREADVMYNNAGRDWFYNAQPDGADYGDDDYVYTETPAALYPYLTVASYGYWRPLSIDPLGTSHGNTEKQLTDGIYAFRPDGDGGDVYVDVSCYLNGAPAHFDWTRPRRRGNAFFADVQTQYIGVWTGGDDFVPYNVHRFNLGPLADGDYSFWATNDERGIGSVNFTIEPGWNGTPMPSRVYTAVGWPVPVV